MTRRREEKKLVEEFIKKSPIPGKYEVEKPIPKTKVQGDKVIVNTLSGIFSLRADIFITTDDGGYVIVEAKTRMNPSQLGQLLCYRDLFAEMYNIDPEKIKMIALCKDVEDSLIKIFEKYGVEINKIDKEKGLLYISK